MGEGSAEELPAVALSRSLFGALRMRPLPVSYMLAGTWISRRSGSSCTDGSVENVAGEKYA